MKRLFLNIIATVIFLANSLMASRDVVHTIRQFDVEDGILTFNLYSLCTDEQFEVGPTTYAINYNQSALGNPFLTNINSKFTLGAPGYGNMDVVMAGGSILITISHNGNQGSELAESGTYGEVICTVGLNVLDNLETAEISWNVVNSAMFQPQFALLDNETFNVQGEPNPSLPVELSSFIANTNGNFVTLNWETTSELNNFGFHIERSLNVENPKWKSIGFRKAAGDNRSTTSYSFTDEMPIGGTHFLYRLKQLDTDGTFEYSDIIEVTFVPVEFSLSQNYPNPFNPTTKIRFSMSEKQNVELVVFDALGQQVTSLINEELDAGFHEIDFNADGYATGLYIYRLHAGNFSAVKKMMLMK
jgi:hypothetical protein